MALQTAAAVAGFDHASNQAGANSRMRPSGSGDMEIDMGRKKLNAIAPATAAYKGFDKDLRCKGFQFEVGKTYTHNGPVKACKGGFHACTDPWDVLRYYGFGDGNRFARVTLSGDTAREPNGDSKIAAGVIAIDAELTFGEFVAELVAHTVTQTGGKGDNPSGDYAQIGSSGNYARIGSSGNGAQIGSSGEYARIGSSGEYAQIGSSGNYARIGSSGYYAQIEIDGSDAVTAIAGRDTWVRASKPAWVSLASYDDDGKCQGFATGQLGADGLKLGTWYRAENCKLVEVA